MGFSCAVSSYIGAHLPAPGRSEVKYGRCQLESRESRHIFFFGMLFFKTKTVKLYIYYIRKKISSVFIYLILVNANGFPRKNRGFPSYEAFQ